MRGTNITMIQLAERIGPYFDRPVIDRTGLTGSFDFRTEYARAGSRSCYMSQAIITTERLRLRKYTIGDEAGVRPAGRSPTSCFSTVSWPFWR